jgi:hypothetical protein
MAALASAKAGERYDACLGYAMYMDAVGRIGNILFPWTYSQSASGSERASWSFPTPK